MKALGVICVGVGLLMIVFGAIAWATWGSLATGTDQWVNPPLFFGLVGVALVAIGSHLSTSDPFNRR